MKYLAKFFFDNHYCIIDDIEDFYSTDLSFLFQLMYRGKLEFKDKGIIKVMKINNKDDPDHGKMIMMEHIFYDYEEDHKEKELELIGYFNIEGQEIKGTKITNTEFGKQLSQQGFTTIDMEKLDALEPLLAFPKLDFKPTNDETMGDPLATFKYNKTIWDNNPTIANETEQIIYDGIFNTYEKILANSEVLQSLDRYDLNILKWEKGRNMTPHNGVDYRSMINMITYNTEHCSETRSIYAGIFDWYDITMQCAYLNDWEPLVNIKQQLKRLLDLPVNTKTGLIVNVFNPRYYHQVGMFRGEGQLYVCTSNKTFSGITNKFSFKW